MLAAFYEVCAYSYLRYLRGNSRVYDIEPLLVDGIPSLVEC
jgi:hypothetical protein